MRVTKKEIRDVLRDARNKHPFGWRLNEIYAYIYNDKFGMFTHYHEQGIYEFLLKEKDDARVYLTDYANKNEWTLKDAVDRAYEDIVDMIEEYKNK